MIAGLVLLIGGAGVGLFGSLLGLGGGILLVPLLTLGFGRPLREAVAISLVSVIVTSSAGAGVYLRRHVANLRLGMTLELFTACGALLGGLVAFALPGPVLEGLFALLLGYVAVSMLRRRELARAAAPTAQTEPAIDADGPLVEGARDGFTTPSPSLPAAPSEPATPDAATALDFTAHLSGPGYRVTHLGLGTVGAVFAGIVSALLGVGGGIVKVPLMTLAMNVPLKVATATSNMMIGITATSSAVIYLLRGEINPYIAGPVAIGVFVGASIGTRVINRIDTRVLRWLFIAVLLLTAVQMAAKAVSR
ncbi:MAG: sulfite exporter TauE/SafE family protein [Candidatus Limnocylindrales bacterium]